MNWIITFLGLLTTILILVITKSLLAVQFWKKRNVEITHVFQLIAMVRKYPVYQIVHKIYKRMCANDKAFQVLDIIIFSAVMVRDQDAIKDIFITKFDNFTERGLYVSEHDPLHENLIRLEYKKWKPLRKRLTPCFSPAKVKYTFESVMKVSEQMCEVVKDKSCQNKGILEMHDISSRFAIDIIGNVAFGVECNSLKDPLAEFKKQGDKSVREHFNPMLDFLGANYPKIVKLWNKKYHSQDTVDFFTNLIQETVSYREKHNIRRQDFIDILMDLKKEGPDNNEVEITTQIMISQAFLFFAAGYESTSLALTEGIYELAKNEAIQEKARNEVFNVMAKHNGKLTYENINELKYIKQISQEILRKYPISHTLPRKCNRSCTLKTAQGPFHIAAGTTVLIPVYAIQHNPEFYPNPEEFSPERFEDDQKYKSQCTFLSFGAGPKICIAERFAMVEMQYGLSLLLSKFRFKPCDLTPDVLVFDRKRIVHLGLENNIFLKVEQL